MTLSELSIGEIAGGAAPPPHAHARAFVRGYWKVMFGLMELAHASIYSADLEHWQSV